MKKAKLKQKLAVRIDRVAYLEEQNSALHEMLDQRDIALREANGVAHTRLQHIQRLQSEAGPLMSKTEKADVEAAYSRGLEAGQRRADDKSPQELDSAFGKILLPVLMHAQALQEEVHKLNVELTEVYAQTSALLNPCQAANPYSPDYEHEHVYIGDAARCTAPGCLDKVEVEQPVYEGDHGALDPLTRTGQDGPGSESLVPGLTHHNRAWCQERGAQEKCAIHNPSDHPLKNARLHWRADRGMLERICPHGIGHPDPDAMAFEKEADRGYDTSGVHGCDGCCSTERQGYS